MKISPLIGMPLAIGLIVAGCGKKETAAHGQAPQIAPHQHTPPHGGTPVVLGREVCHLELVLDANVGKLSAYLLDGEMENYIRVAAPSFEVVATVDGARQPLVFRAMEDPATGETAGDTALFEATAGWLKTTKEFDAVLTQLDVHGTVFTGIAFNFPRGNDKD